MIYRKRNILISILCIWLIGITLVACKKYEKTNSGTQYSLIKEYDIKGTENVTENVMNLENLKINKAEIKDGKILATLNLELKDEDIAYTTLDYIKNIVFELNKEQFKEKGVNSFEFTVSGKGKSWLFNKEDKISEIKIK